MQFEPAGSYRLCHFVRSLMLSRIYQIFALLEVEDFNSFAATILQNKRNSQTRGVKFQLEMINSRN